MSYLRREQLGSSLLLLGLTFGWCVSAVFGIGTNVLTRVIMLLSVAPFLKGINYVHNTNLKIRYLILFVYQITITLLAVYFDKKEDLIYNLYLIAVISVLMLTASNDRDLWKNNHVFFVMGVFIVVSFFIINTLGKENLYDRTGIGYSNNYPVIATSMLIFLFYSLTFYQYKFRFLYLGVNLLLSVLVMMNIFSLVSRTAILGFLLGILLFLLKRSSDKFKKRFLICAIIIGIMTIILIPSFRNAFESIIDIFTRGLKSFIGVDGNSNIEMSASTRKKLRDEALTKISSEMHLKEFLFGFGYKDRYLDFPVLQIFMDLGFLGAVFYCTLFILYPFYKIMRRRNWTFMDYIFIMNSLNFLTVGQPYDFVKLVPVIMWYSFSACFKENRIEQKDSIYIRNQRPIN